MIQLNLEPYVVIRGLVVQCSKFIVAMMPRWRGAIFGPSLSYLDGVLVLYLQSIDWTRTSSWTSAKRHVDQYLTQAALNSSPIDRGKLVAYPKRLIKSHIICDGELHYALELSRVSPRLPRLFGSCQLRPSCGCVGLMKKRLREPGGATRG